MKGLIWKYCSVMVRITSGIIALGWGWQNWKNLQSDSETQTKETILGQHDYWLQWLDRVMERVNETQPPGAEVVPPPTLQNNLIYRLVRFLR